MTKNFIKYNHIFKVLNSSDTNTIHCIKHDCTKSSFDQNWTRKVFVFRRCGSGLSFHIIRFNTVGLQSILRLVYIFPSSTLLNHKLMVQQRAFQDKSLSCWPPVMPLFSKNQWWCVSPYTFIASHCSFVLSRCQGKYVLKVVQSKHTTAIMHVPMLSLCMADLLGRVSNFGIG